MLIIGSKQTQCVFFSENKNEPHSADDSSPKSQQAKRLERQTAISVMVVSVNYLLMTTLYYLYFYLGTLSYFDSTPKRYMDIHIVFGFNALLLVTANSAINCFIYFIFGRKFRRDLISFFSKLFRRNSSST